MSNLEPYVEYKPGQLIAAEIMNDMQSQIREDIGAQAQDAVNAITQVPSAQDSERLEGQSLDSISQSIIDQAISQMALRSGYMRLYKKLEVGEEKVIDHQLQNSPLVDLYQLDYFEVVASEDDYKYVSWVNFFIYHSSEKRIRFVPEGGGTPVSVEVEPTDGEPYRIPFADMLTRYEVDYTENSSLGEIENELWDAIFSAPNDRFDDQQYAHSPWFDRCCREERTVKSLKQKGDWDDIWVKVMPRKTENYPLAADGEDEDGNPLPTAAPTMVQVSHFSFNKLGLKLLTKPVYASDVIEGLRLEGRDVDAIQQELKLMVLLRA